MQIANTVYYRLNLLLATIYILVNLLLYFVLPLFLNQNPVYAFLILPIILLTTGYWSVIHETIHNSFHPSPPVNNSFGRLLCLFFPAPWQVLRLGHLVHHGFNRTRYDQSEIFSLKENRFATAIRYYYHLLVGLYVSELLSLFLVLAPRKILNRFIAKMFADDPEGKKIKRLIGNSLFKSVNMLHARIDALISMAILLASIMLYQEHVWLLALILAGRGLMISLFDNAYHYAIPLQNRQAAYNLRTRRWWQKLILNFNLHHTHHRYPGLPWFRLPQRFIKDRDTYSGEYLATTLKQFRGPRYSD